MGYAVLDGADLERLVIADCGVIATPREATAAERLVALADALDVMIARYAPRAVAVERLFFNKNVRTAMSVSEARGVALVCAARAGLAISEFTPQEVKLGVTGTGAADKRTVQKMLVHVLRLEERISDDNVADAVAVAVTYAHRARFAARVALAR